MTVRICSDERDFDSKSKEMTGFFFINRGYPQQIIQQARNREAVTPREAIISGPVDVVVDQPTIPSSVDIPSYQHTGQKHPYTQPPFITKRTRTPQRFFKLCTFYLPIVAIAICVTPWLGVPFMTRPLSMMTVEHFHVADPGVIFALVRTSQHL